MSTEDIYGAVAAYWSIALGLFFFGAWAADESVDPERSAMWARAGLWSPLWPLVLIVAAVAFMARTVRQMVRYSRGEE